MGRLCHFLNVSLLPFVHLTGSSKYPAHTQSPYSQHSPVSIGISIAVAAPAWPSRTSESPAGWPPEHCPASLCGPPQREREHSTDLPFGWLAMQLTHAGTARWLHQTVLHVPAPGPGPRLATVAFGRPKDFLRRSILHHRSLCISAICPVKAYLQTKIGGGGMLAAPPPPISVKFYKAVRSRNAAQTAYGAALRYLQSGN